MRERPEKPVFGPETAKLAPRDPPEVKVWRSIAKALSWRVVGTIDTLILSYLLITYLGPIFGLNASGEEALEVATYIALTEVATKLVLYFVHERVWAGLRWGLSVVGGARSEGYARTSVKTATWRVIASLDTMMLGWIYTGNLATAISIGSLEIVTKLILYFLHERAWANLSFELAQTSKEEGGAH